MEYTDLIRARMVRRMVGPGAMTATALARESGISQATLSRWLKGAASIRTVSTKQEDPHTADVAANEKRPQDWSVKERMQLVLEADGLADHELGELLRRRGVHREQLDEWRAAVEEALSAPTGRRSPASKRIKQLEREVARKDKALAETAALLVLQKNSRERGPILFGKAQPVGQKHFVVA